MLTSVMAGERAAIPSGSAKHSADSLGGNEAGHGAAGSRDPARTRLPSRHTAVTRLFRAKGVVDPAFYRAEYPDVAAEGVEPLLHYLRHGWREGRKPRPDRILTMSLTCEASSTTPRPWAEAVSGQAHLIVLHAWGGGTARYAALLGETLRRKGRQPIFVWGEEEATLLVTSTSPSQEDARFVLPAEWKAAVRWLRRKQIVRADVLHTIGLDQTIVPLLRALDVPYDITLLDYHLVATSPHLLDESGVTAAVGQESESIALRPLLRERPHPVVADAERRLACSADLAARISRLFPDLGVIAVRPPEPSRPQRYRVTPPVPILPDEPSRVLLLGYLASHKGQEAVIAVAKEAWKQRLPLEFHVLGKCLPELSAAAQTGTALFVCGHFLDETLTSCVTRIAPHLAWFPAQASETYGFALSEAMLLGLPILATGIGAYRERLAGRPFTWTVPSEAMSTRVWLETLVALRNNDLRTVSSAPTPHGLPPIIDDFYEKHYLEDLRSAPGLQNK